MRNSRRASSDPPDERGDAQAPGSPSPGIPFMRRRMPRWPEEGHHRRLLFQHPFRFRIGCLLPLFFSLSAFGCIAAGLISYYQYGFSRDVPRGYILFPILVFLLLTIILGGFLRRMVNPLDEVMEAADKVAAGDYSTRLKEAGPRPVKAFTHSFNTMTERLQAYDEQRKRMLADISHELRTPLTVLQGNLEGMLDNVYPRDEEHIQLLLEETRILARLIEDLRTFSLVETGKLVLQKEPCDPVRMVRDLVHAMQAYAARREVKLVDQAQAGTPPAELDSARIREVLENLVANAIRHTPAGGTIRVACRRRPENPARLEFRVEDNGRGIPPELLAHIFDRYVKSVDSGGTGLGLAISRRLVEAHGGGIHAESIPGNGTTIHFWIPFSPPGFSA
ncbi:MAG: HAMP domain-containing histidine kinase [Anaerolineales bacterium]|nr:HAMP domain-containing histidine kinase [Anaerolineales bacterium]